MLAFPQPERRRAFEFGAATGNDLVEFRRAGWEVFGCEPSAQACAYAARRGFSLQCCNAEDAEPPPNLTCVYMNNVFEHLHDPRAVLATSRAALEPKGLLVLVVPNHASWAARLFGAAWPGYDPPKHIWGFTPKSIRRLIESSGFRVLTIRQVFPASNCCWHSGLHGGRAPAASWPRARAVAARLLGRAVIPVGVLAAWFGHGDYIRIVAAKV